LQQPFSENNRSFLLEIGGDFSYIGNQYKLDLDGEEFFIDLLLYHRSLKCLVAIEQKATDFKPEYTGQIKNHLNCPIDRMSPISGIIWEPFLYMLSSYRIVLPREIEIISIDPLPSIKIPIKCKDASF
jgi:hypothetical protein